MSLRTFNLSVVAAEMTGNALPNGKAIFTLTKADVYQGLVVPRSLTVSLDGSGHGTAALWPNGDGTQGSQYHIIIRAKDGSSRYQGLFTMPASDANLHDILDLVAPPTVDDATAAKNAAQGYAATAGSSASAAAASRAAADADASATAADRIQTAADRAAAAASASAAATYAVAQLMGWALAQSFRLSSVTRNSDGAITAASIAWPDGSAGVFTTDTLSTAFPGSIDAWHATYVGAGGTLTVTQPAVTRDSTTGAVTAQPAITIA